LGGGGREKRGGGKSPRIWPEKEKKIRPGPSLRAQGNAERGKKVLSFGKGGIRPIIVGRGGGFGQRWGHERKKTSPYTGGKGAHDGEKSEEAMGEREENFLYNFEKGICASPVKNKDGKRKKGGGFRKEITEFLRPSSIEGKKERSFPKTDPNVT